VYKNLLLLPVVTFSVLIDCAAAEIYRCADDSGVTFSDTPCPIPSADELRTSPIELNVHGSKLELETYAWLNLMPTGEYRSGRTYTHLRLNLTVRSTNGQPFPKDVTFGDRGWILVNNAVYEIEVSEWSRDESKISTQAGGTPEWSRGVEIEVVVKLVVGSKTAQLRSMPINVVEAY
jgi:hypothetical protein